MALLIALVVMIAPTMAADSQAAQSQDGFRALDGEAARAFRVPADVRVVDQRSYEGTALASGALHVNRYQQYLGEAQVFGGQLTTLNNADGETLAVVGGHFDNLAPQNHVAISANDARLVASEQIARGGRWITTLMINPDNGRYFYNVENMRFDSRWIHWVDAETGEIINSLNALTHGEGTGVLGDTKDLTGLTSQSGSSYVLVSPDGRLTTYDARNRNRLPGVIQTDADDNWNTPGSDSPGHPAMVDAHFYANVTDSYYQSTHSFNWTNYYPQGMVSSAHVQRNYNNAFWNGQQMAYGDGDGSSFIELSGDLDVVGHELSHGVTEATSNLIYQNESGALNEAFSDIMGTSIEYYYGSGNWTIGEDITPGDNGIRNMANPNEDSDPSHYDERYTGTGDNGGVHINSGIANHWYYLLVNGGQNANPTYASGQNVQGIGLSNAEEVAFLGFTALNASADFCDARASTIAVAGNNSANVTDAWDEVGVDEALCGGGNPGGGDGPTISNVSSFSTQGRSFAIVWDTDVPSDSTVTFTCCGSYSDSAMVTSHRMDFNGQKNVNYEFFVTSTDSNGDSTTEGPFYHQN
jgi:Zn-dependent metalloprotease